MNSIVFKFEFKRFPTVITTAQGLETKGKKNLCFVMLYFGAFHGQTRKNSFAKHNNDSLFIHCLRGLFSLRKPHHDKLGVEVLFLKFRAHQGSCCS